MTHFLFSVSKYWGALHCQPSPELPIRLAYEKAGSRSYHYDTDKPCYGLEHWTLVGTEWCHVSEDLGFIVLCQYLHHHIFRQECNQVL